MDDIILPDRRKKWFLWGILLAGFSTLPLVITVFATLRAVPEVSPQHAIGIGAMAGGFLEFYTAFGLILSFLLPFTAIVLLAKSFAEGRRGRALFSIISICWSALMFAIPAFVAWQLFNRH